MIARNYHERTKHSYWSVRTNPHYLDWSNRPLPFNIYETLEPIPLPKDVSVFMPALEAIATDGNGAAGQQIPDLAALARIFYLSNGITKVRRAGGEAHYFRAASCTGALYHIELYLVCGDLPDPSAALRQAEPTSSGQALSAGVYHYGAHDHALRRLRAGDFREIVVRATTNEPQLSHAPAIIICTDTFWRNTWKYQARAYRHSGWDNGVILANLLATAAANTALFAERYPLLLALNGAVAVILTGLVAYQLLDFELYLAGDLLTKVDRCSMAHGVESRAPFLRQALVEKLGVGKGLEILDLGCGDGTTALPAANLGLSDRGMLRKGQAADVVAFDPATIADRATFDKPHQYAVGMRHVLVNGVPVLLDGEHTGALPGRFVKGRGRPAARTSD